MASFAQLQATRNQRRGTGLGSSETPDPAKRSGIPSPIKGEEESVTSPESDTGPQSSSSSKTPKDVYPDFSPNVEIRQSPGSGRSLFTTSPIPKASRIITTSPYTFALSTSSMESHCSYCWLSPYEIDIKSTDLSNLAALGPPASFKKHLSSCAGCSVTKYCSKQCQKAAWSGHAKECRALKKMRAMWEEKNGREDGTTSKAREKAKTWVPPESVRALATVFWERRRSLDDEGASNGSPSANSSKGDYAQVKALQSHRGDMSDKEQEPFGQLAADVIKYLSAGEAVISSEEGPKMIDRAAFGFQSSGEILDLCAAFASNSYTLSSSTLEPIGVALSPLVALINHSCQPNAVVVFPGGQRPGEKGMHVIALRDLAAGEEILTSYLDVASPYSVRQEELRKTYRFECSCALCAKTLECGVAQKGSWVDPRWAVKHPSCSRSGTSPMPDLALGLADCVCNGCGEQYEVFVGRIRNLQTASDKLLKADGQKLPVDLVELDRVVGGLQEILPISSHPLLPLLRIQSMRRSEIIFEGSQSSKDISVSIYPLALHWKGSQEVYVANQPTLAVILAELGKLLNAESFTDGRVRALQADPAQNFKLPTDPVGRSVLARETMTNALNVAQVGFGKSGGLVGKELGMMIEAITRELTLRSRRR